MRLRQIRRTAILSTALLWSGCMTWRTETRPAAEVVNGPPALDYVRVTQLNGKRVELLHPQVRNDSLLGLNRGKPHGMPVADIRELATHHGSPGKTLGLILGLPAAFVVVLAVGSAGY
jgi:hypothetical protein